MTTPTPTPGTPTPGASAPDASAPTSADTVIAEKRRRIDELDTRILDLVRERMTESADIQRARMTSGGRRVSLNREMEVLTHYSAELGKPGTSLAMTLLELCRGKV
ncbi:chorismate mutase [Streptomyces sp. CBMA29]|uniref:chorismate mutase n=1 Tax=Streptomyces sp. CBMA29 TaxID=1896314 RepID=UPI001661F9A6|nr:chorismate mutase [Streptomyces sp. CBMA29]MBD0736614.1 chorismate mutase [Streptomyces sp. CBMA29]